jgi:riboflavin kinase/FMN adenylyltransferase
MRSVVTIGNFDGVHLGHRALLSKARAIADAEGLRVRAMFFDPHPAAFFRPDSRPPLLTPLPRRKALLLGAGADEVDIRTFDTRFAEQSAEAFATDVLAADAKAAAVVVGSDFRFGKDREGDLPTLERLGEAHGFAVHVVAPVEHDGAVVSSTRIRRRLAEGDVAGARALLGRYHDVRSEVIHGDHRGRTIGFPTANLALPEKLALPSDGVYAVIASVDGAKVGGVANIGVRPTFDAGRSVEVHLLDWEGDLYGRSLPVAFVARIRGEKKFDGVEALVEQIGRDAAGGRGRLADVLHTDGDAVLPDLSAGEPS